MDYITDIDTRRDIFLEFRDMARRNKYSLNAVALGFMMVAPLDELRRRLEDGRSDEARFGKEGPFVTGFFGIICGQAAIEAMRACRFLISEAANSVFRNQPR